MIVGLGYKNYMPQTLTDHISQGLYTCTISSLTEYSHHHALCHRHTNKTHICTYNNYVLIHTCSFNDANILVLFPSELQKGSKILHD